MGYLLTTFPAQKKPRSKKTTEWKKQCVDGAENAAIYSEEDIRKSKRNKQVNYNLYSNMLDETDVEQICNPLKLKGFSTPVKMQNYPLANPKIDVLIGEEEYRKFDWRVRVVNEDAISEKSKRATEEWKKFILTQIQDESADQQEYERRIAEFQRYMDYEWQDLKELRATLIVKDLWERNKLDRLFNKGFKDALLAAEEIYEWDIIGGEPVCRRLNPINVYTTRSGESPYIEDADIIVIEEYYSMGRIIDEYSEWLTDGEIDKLESYFSTTGRAEKVLDPYLGTAQLHLALKVEDTLDEAMLANNILGYSPAFDSDGNFRVLKVRWRSMRKMQKLTYYDQEGNQQEDLVDEKYKADPNKGEQTETIWINEWWEGHKIAGGVGFDENAIYTKMQVRPVQYRSRRNLAKAHPGIVGTIYNTNDNKGISLMDRMKPYQYLYNVIWYNAEMLIATNWGKIMKIPLHEIPDGWDEDMWLYYAKVMKAVPYDAFKEGKKGAATGKIAGTMNTQSPVLDMEMGQSLQFYMLTLQYIEQKMGEIAGISPQRMGAVQNRETLGGVERSVTQSSMITEYWFAEHDYLKKRVLEAGLETAKVAYKEKKILSQFIMDDFLSKMEYIDGDEFADADYGIFISSSWKDKQTFESIRQLAQSALQGGMMDFGQLLDLWTSDSISSMRRKFQTSEKARKQFEEAKMKQQQEMLNQQLQAQAQEKQADRQHDFAMENQKHQNTITIKQLELQAKAIEKRADLDADGIPDAVELEKVRADERMQREELAHESRENEKQRNFEAKQNAKERENDLKIAKAKPKPKTS